jgi:hypothetical protein
VAEGQKPYAYVATPASELSGGFSPDGRWFSYASNESGRLMAVDLSARGANLEIGKPRSIFGGIAMRYPAGLTRDGRRLLMAVPAMEAASPALTLLVNWQVALAQP